VVDRELVVCCIIVTFVDLVNDQYRQYVRDPVLICLEIEQDLLRMKGRVGIRTVESEWSCWDSSLVTERYLCCLFWTLCLGNKQNGCKQIWCIFGIFEIL
jgi:hypothetical protein